MDIKIKILVVILPFVIAALVGFSYLQPAMEDAHTKEASISEKNTENDNLSAKLRGSAKISERQTQLRNDIEKLRGSVPHSPDTDLLTIDLEKMCKDAGMNMIAVTGAKESSGPRPSAEDATKKKQDKLKNMLKGGGAGGAAASAIETGPPGGELEHLSKQFTVSGDYAGLQRLVHELETYQRVVRIDELSFHLPKKELQKGHIKIDEAGPAEGEEGGDPRLMFITMTLTSYYLP